MRIRYLLIAALLSCHRQDPPPGPTTAPPAPVVAVAPTGSPVLVPVPKAIADGVALEEIAHGLARPVLLVSPPHDPRRFVVEQRGRIVILPHTTFFTIKGLADGNEEGLLGLAFHPRFETNGKLYVNYTSEDMATHIVEYHATGDRVDPASAREIIRIDQPYSNHNGGNLVFGPDGKLYTGMGDGGSAGDPHGNGQNPKALLGKILRFDVDAAHPAPEIVHVGARNPWRFWFDAASGDLYIGDVGQNLWENVYVVPNDGARRNFGWNVVEGNHCFGHDDCDRTGFTAPVADYPHEQGCSVTGGVTYRGKALPQLDGRYFYADYCTGLLRSFLWTAPAIREHWDWKAAIDRAGILDQISSFGVDADGEVYLVELTGSIYKLVPKR